MSGTCMYLSDEERDVLVTQGWVQLAGPFDIEEDCLINCGSSSSSLSSSSSCGILGDYDLTWDEIEQAWLFSDNTVSIRMWCDGTTFQLSIDCPSSSSGNSIQTECCSNLLPSSIEVDVTGCTTGSLTITYIGDLGMPGVSAWAGMYAGTGCEEEPVEFQLRCDNGWDIFVGGQNAGGPTDITPDTIVFEMGTTECTGCSPGNITITCHVSCEE